MLHRVLDFGGATEALEAVLQDLNGVLAEGSHALTIAEKAIKRTSLQILCSLIDGSSGDRNEQLLQLERGQVLARRCIEYLSLDAITATELEQVEQRKERWGLR